MKEIIRNIFGVLKRAEKRRFFWVAACDVVINVLDIAFLLGLLFVVNFYTGNRGVGSHSVALPGIVRSHPLSLITTFFLLFALKNYAGYYTSAIAYRYVYAVASRISAEKMKGYFVETYQKYVEIDSSVMSREISQQPVEFAHYLLSGLQQCISQCVMITITASAIVWFDPVVFPLLILLLAPPVALLLFLLRKKLSLLGQASKKTGEKTQQHLQEALSGYVDSNVFGRNDFFADRYAQQQAKLNGQLANRLVIQNLPTRLIEVFALSGFLLLVLVNSWMSPGLGISLIPAGALLVAAYKIIPGVVKLINLSTQMKSYAYACSALNTAGVEATEGTSGFSFDVRESRKEEHATAGNAVAASQFSLDSRPAAPAGLASISIHHTRFAAKAQQRISGAISPGPHCNIQCPPRLKRVCFDKVDFAFHQHNVLSHFSFSVQEGEMLGVSGFSGRGKTTIVNLLLGFLDQHAGKIIFNNSVVSAIGRRKYWPQVAYVKQHPFLIYATIRENITLQNESRPVQLHEALTASGLDELIARMPGGLDTMITENGKNFSGGQRQRIAFARALYKKADLLILDEPFNELDEDSETAMLLQLKRLAADGCMIILITHNPTALSYCTRQITLDDH